MVTFSPAANFQNQLILELVWGFIAQAEYSCMIKCFMKLRGAEGSQHIQIRAAENKIVMTWFCQPSAHLLKDKGVCRHLGPSFSLGINIPARVWTPTKFWLKQQQGEPSSVCFILEGHCMKTAHCILPVATRQNQRHLFFTVNMQQLPHTHSQERHKQSLCTLLSKCHTCVRYMLSWTVKFNWDTDGNNFGVMILIVLLMKPQHFLAFFFFFSSAVRKWRATAIAALT